MWLTKISFCSLKSFFCTFNWFSLIETNCTISMLYTHCWLKYPCHYNGVMMGAMVSQITSLTIVYSTVYSNADQRKHQSSASLAFVREFTGWIPAQMASNAENVSIWWRHHAKIQSKVVARRRHKRLHVQRCSWALWYQGRFRASVVFQHRNNKLTRRHECFLLITHLLYMRQTRNIGF